MDIKQHTQYIIAHPAFSQAMADANKMFDLIYSVQLHCIEVQIRNSAKEYGSCRRMNYSDIKEALLCMRQPDNLSVYLRIPETPCVVISLSRGSNENSPVSL